MNLYVKYLCATLKFESEKNREAISSKLILMGKPAIMPLCRTLKSNDGLARQEAAKAIREISLNIRIELVKLDSAEPQKPTIPRTNSAKNLLIEAVRDPRKEIRLYIIDALGIVRDDFFIEVLLLALSDYDSDVRGYAAHALGELKDFKAIAPLKRAVMDRSEYVRHHAKQALTKFKTGTNEKSQSDGLFPDADDKLHYGKTNYKPPRGHVRQFG